MAKTIDEMYVEYRSIYDSVIPDVPFESMVDAEEFKKCPCAPALDSGVAYDGSLMYHLTLILHFAKQLSSNGIFGTLNLVTEESLKKVIVLHQLGKVGMFIPNTDDWQVKKLGKVYNFAESNVCLKTGERSRLLCSNAGIKFTPEEYEAMTIMDKTAEEYENMSKHRTMLSTIIRMANEMAYTMERERFKMMNTNK